MHNERLHPPVDRTTRSPLDIRVVKTRMAGSGSHLRLLSELDLVRLFRPRPFVGNPTGPPPAINQPRIKIKVSLSRNRRLQSGHFCSTSDCYPPSHH